MNWYYIFLTCLMAWIITWILKIIVGCKPYLSRACWGSWGLREGLSSSYPFIISSTSHSLCEVFAYSCLQVVEKEALQLTSFLFTSCSQRICIVTHLMTNNSSRFPREVLNLSSSVYYSYLFSFLYYHFIFINRFWKKSPYYHHWMVTALTMPSGLFVCENKHNIWYQKLIFTWSGDCIGVFRRVPPKHPYLSNKPHKIHGMPLACLNLPSLQI